MYFFTNFFGNIAGWVYMFLWFVVFLNIFLKSKVLDKIGILGLFIFSIFFLGLRDEYSATDTYNYVLNFLAIKENPYKYNYGDFKVEFGFYFLNVLISRIGDWQFFLVSIVVLQLAFLLATAVIFNIRFQSPVLLAYISFLPGFDMLTNGIRQGLALCLFMLLLSLVHKKKISKLWLISTFLFHASMIVVIPGIFYNIIKKFGILFITLFFLLLFLYFFSGAEYIETLKYELGYFVNENFNLNVYELGYKLYKNIVSEFEFTLTFKYYFLFLLILFLIFSLTLLAKLKLNQSVKSRTEILLSYVIYFSILYGVLWFSPHSYRLMYLTYIPLIFIIIISLEQLSVRYTILYFVVIFISAFFVYGSNTFANFHFIY